LLVAYFLNDLPIFIHNKECGLTFHRPNVLLPKIVGGSEAVKNSWPSAVRFEFLYHKKVHLAKYNVSLLTGEEISCGGVLINRNTGIYCGFIFWVYAHPHHLHPLLFIKSKPNYINFFLLFNLCASYKVLTAAHCILKSFSFDYKNKTYYELVVPNEYYPTNGSMYQVLLGLHEDRDEATISQVKNVIVVGEFIKKVKFFKKFP
jgi:hypothetical protein